MKRNLVTLALAAATALAGLAAGTPASAETLRVASYPANPPWEAKKEDGTFEGFEVDVVTEVAKRLGAELEIQDYDFPALFPAISGGRADMAISSISITQERLQNQAFSQGYYTSDMALITANDSDIKSWEDMRGKPVGAISTSTGEAWIQAHTEEYGFGEYKGYPTQQNLLLDTQAGRVAGAVGDIPGFQWAFLQMPTMHIVERIEVGDQYGIMMQKGSPLVERVNEAITAMKEDGTMAAIHKKWLGADPEPGSSTVTVLDLPQAQ